MVRPAMAEPMLSPGMVVGETWEIVEPIGRGGMGEVWLAKHKRIDGKQAAIKVLRKTTDGMPDQITRFRREAEIAARLEHPNIVQLFDFSFLPSGAPYLVMELLRGESLGHRLSRGPMPLAELQEVITEVGAALHVAHAAGVVHRDLKPENIFLISTPTGTTVKVLDFGISKLVDSDSVMTSDSIVLGTPQYMSPEQAMAEHQTITGQSDLFSLGTICFEALTGHRPFAATTLARTVYLVAMEPSPSLRTYAPDLPAHVIDAVDHALAKQPADRTPDIATFVKEFCGAAPVKEDNASLSLRERVGVRVNEPTVSSRSPAPRPAEAKAKPWPLIVLGGVIVAGVIGFVASRPVAEVSAPSAGAAIVAVPPPVFDAGLVAEGVNPHPEPVFSPNVVAPRGFDPKGEGEKHVVKFQPATPEQKELLDNARAAVAQADWNSVIDWTLKPAIAERSDAITLRVLAWCHLGNLNMVSAYKSRVAPSEKHTVARACAAQGIDL